MRPPHRHFQHLYELCNLDLLQFHLLFWQLLLLPLWYKKIKHVINDAIQNHLASISTQGELIQKIVSSLLHLITEDIPKHKYHLRTSEKVTELQTFEATHANMHMCDPDTYWQLKTTQLIAASRALPPPCFTHAHYIFKCQIKDMFTVLPWQYILCYQRLQMIISKSKNSRLKSKTLVQLNIQSDRIWVTNT